MQYNFTGSWFYGWICKRAFGGIISQICNGAPEGKENMRRRRQGRKRHQQPFHASAKHSNAACIPQFVLTRCFIKIILTSTKVEYCNYLCNARCDQPMNNAYGILLAFRKLLHNRQSDLNLQLLELFATQTNLKLNKILNVFDLFCYY